MFLKRFQLGLIHVAVAMTLLPINSTLNRVMIKELAISATLVAILASLPYLFSPIQVAIGSFADRHPVFGLRRTPYILLGLVLCVLGVVISPQAAFLLAGNLGAGIPLSLLSFGAWGMGFNFATVSYLSLASEISTEKSRGRTISVMFFMMIVSIIATAIVLGRLVDPYSPEAMVRAFWIIGITALVLGALGLVGLERGAVEAYPAADDRASGAAIIRTVLQNRQATQFFWYLIILLAAILGQDILLEPYGAEAFGLSVRETTRITSLWGTCMLAALVIAGLLDRRVSRRKVAIWGGVTALSGFILIAASGAFHSSALFYSGVVLLGVGTGLSTVSNLSLMLDMIAPGKVGLFMGAWGMANAFSRLAGSVLGGAVRDVVSQLVQNLVTGYVVVFGIEAFMLLVSLVLLRRIDVSAFRKQAETIAVVERAALVNE
ncbi:MAG: MFS transporter [Chloroflexota bacterium]|nr:MAG: MFS transporter [Chloroflexota bacterium]